MSSKKKNLIRRYRCKLDYWIYQDGGEYELRMVTTSGIIMNVTRHATYQEAIDIVNQKIDFVFKGTK